MTFSKVKPAGWVLNEKLTSAEITALDLNVSKALDSTGCTLTGGMAVDGSITINDGAVLRIDDGGQINTVAGGEIFVDVDGSLNVDGYANLDGYTSITGTAAISATTTIGGALTIIGATEASNLTISDGNQLHYSVRIVTRTMRSTPWFDPDDITMGIDGSLTTQVAHSYFVVPFDMPNGSELFSLSIYVAPATTHTSTLPTLPNIIFTKLHVRTGVTTELGTASDDSSNKSEYEAVHDISIVGLSEIVDNTVYKYSLYVQTEGTSNGLDQATYYPPTASFTVTDGDDGAS